MTTTCAKCKTEKANSEFYPSSLRQRTPGRIICRACFRDYERARTAREHATSPHWTTRICARCGVEKGEDGYCRSMWLRLRGSAWCRNCHRKYYRDRAQQEPGYFGKYLRRRRDRQRAYFSGIKAQLGCAHCGEHDPVCLEFHHMDPRRKKLNISAQIAKGCAIEHVEREVKKCIVLCSNCHRKFHARDTTLADWRAKPNTLSDAKKALRSIP